MDDVIEKQPWWENLTYIAQEQLLELLKRHKTYENTRKSCILFGLIVAALVLVIFETQLKSLPLIYILGFLAIGFLVVTYGVIEYTKPSKNSFEKHRETMIKALSGQFCTHGGKCDCKDQVARYFKEKKKINLIF